MHTAPQDNMMMVLKDHHGLRLDKWLRLKHPQVPYIAWAKLCRKGSIRLQGKRVTGAERVEEGQTVRLPPLSVLQKLMVDQKSLLETPLSPEAKKDLESWIVYEDQEILCFNKPFGLATQGGTKTVKHMDGLLRRWAFEKQFTPKIVHRLDRDTSGLLLVAKTAPSARRLGLLFKTRQIQKCYVGVTLGVPNPLSGTIRVPLKKDLRGQKEKMVPASDGKGASTRYSVLSTSPGFAVVALSPITGRTHQLRAHMQHIGTPLLGDTKYGSLEQPNNSLKKLHLHAALIKIPRQSAESLVLVAPISHHMTSTLQEFGQTESEIMQKIHAFSF